MKNITFTGNAFVFDFDYSDFLTKVDIEKKRWKIKVSGDVVLYDREKKKHVRISDVVNEILIPLAGRTDLNGDLTSQILDKQVPGAFVEELFRWFRYFITGYHAQVGSNKEFYRSPIDGNEYDVSNMLAYNLAKKFVFKFEFAGDNKDFAKAWIDYLQA